MSEDTFSIIVAVLLLCAAVLLAAPALRLSSSKGLPTVLALRAATGELIAIGDLWTWRDGGETLEITEIVGHNVILVPLRERGAVFRLHPDDLVRRMRRVTHETIDVLAPPFDDDRTAIHPGPPTTIPPPPPSPWDEENVA